MLLYRGLRLFGLTGFGALVTLVVYCKPDECLRLSDCGDGYTCSDGLCVGPADATADGPSVDAHRGDVEREDARRPDAGADALRKAGSQDAEHPDSDDHDAGRRDGDVREGGAEGGEHADGATTRTETGVPGDAGKTEEAGKADSQEDSAKRSDGAPPDGSHD